MRRNTRQRDLAVSDRLAKHQLHFLELGAFVPERPVAVNHEPSDRGLERSAADQTVVFIEGIRIDFHGTALSPMRPARSSSTPDTQISSPVSASIGCH